MADRFGNPEKVHFKEERMVNREYDEIIDKPKQDISSPKKVHSKHSDGQQK